jgi:chemotaxis protein MotB
MSGTNPPIIIVKKKAAAHGHHGGAWKVAYADFVTALMALFIVLWLMTASQDIKKAIAGYFRDPMGYSTKIGTALGGVGETLTLNKNNMNELKTRLQDALLKNPDLSMLKNYVQMTITGEGLRIELLENEKGVFFENGDAQPTENGRKLLMLIAGQLGRLQNRILIEGHTDAKPYQGSLYSNWELSADRANVARRIMQANGVRLDQVSQVRGFADQQLRLPDRPEDPSNRRISIIVQYSEADVLKAQQSLTPNPPAAAKPAASPAGSAHPLTPAPAHPQPAHQ